MLKGCAAFCIFFSRVNCGKTCHDFVVDGSNRSSGSNHKSLTSNPGFHSCGFRSRQRTQSKVASTFQPKYFVSTKMVSVAVFVDRYFSPFFTRSKPYI